MFRRLIQDEAGFVLSTELVLTATILVIGLVVGQATVRDQVVTELVDVADASSAIDQGYDYSEVTGHAARTAGTVFDDVADFCDAVDNGAQGVGGSSGTCTNIGFGRFETFTGPPTGDSL